MAVLTGKAWQCFEPIKIGFLDHDDRFKEGSETAFCYCKSIGIAAERWPRPRGTPREATKSISSTCRAKVRYLGALVSEKAYVGDVEYRSFVLMRAIVSSPEEIANMCRGAMRLSQKARDRIVARAEREERLRLAGLRSAKTQRTRAA